jgi:UDP-GlcNAc3NAcA epimerase
MKVVTILGARPQFIKAAAVSRIFSEQKNVKEIIVHTGQHFDFNMSELFFNELDIPRPDHILETGGLSHGAMTGRMLQEIEQILFSERPHCVLVYGDTNSTLAGALAAAKLNINLAHVEAGLRSFNRKMPEEVNRILTDHLADMLFTPTDSANRNLVREGISPNTIHLVGDVMYDACIYYKSRAKEPIWFRDLKFQDREFVLATVHRAENTDDGSRLSAIFKGLAESGRQVIMPLHPRTRKSINSFGLHLQSNIHLAPPVSFLEMQWLEQKCALIATDSGGVQKEAYFNRKPCITLRDETEWVELVEIGANMIVGTENNRISAAISNGFNFDNSKLLFGAGNAAELIVDRIAKII